MEIEQSISKFFSAISEDPRISPIHISLYMALLELSTQKKGKSSMNVFSHEVMPLAKISGISTYYKAIRDLSNFGYIQYIASYNHFQGSIVSINEIKQSSKT